MTADRQSWRALFVRVLVYYLVLMGVVLGSLYFFPELEPYVPVGGLDQFATGATFDEVVTTYREEASSDAAFRGVSRLMTAVLMSVSIGMTLLTMVPIVWVYQATHGTGSGDKKKDRTVLETLVVLPIIITAIVLIIQHSIALAFGLAGIVAGVQYRNRLALSIDAAYLFTAIAIGISSGIEAAGIGIVMSLWFCLTIVGLKILGVTEEERVSDKTPNVEPAGKSKSG
jgi:hypothetical protein